MNIFQAAQKGNEQEVIRWLDADPTLVETVHVLGIRLLALAACYNQLGMVRLLVQRGANINATGVEEMTALHWAAGEGHEEMVALLLDQGAEVNSTDAWDRTSLITASMSGHLGVVRLLAQHTGTQGLNEEDDEGRTALHYAAQEGHCEVVAFLLSKGAQASTRNTVNETPLISASRCGHIGVVRLLLQHMGARGLQDRDDAGWTALLNAAYWGQDEVLRFLLLAGADHTITDNEGQTTRALAEMELDEEELDEEDHYDMLKEGKVRCVAVLQVGQTTCPHFQASPSVGHSMTSQSATSNGGTTLTC
jgi:ankyrin repeat protein